MGGTGAAAPAVPPASAGQRPATPIPSAPATPTQVAPATPTQAAPATPTQAAPVQKPQTPPKPELSAEERQKILDDDKLNNLLKVLPGAKITDLR